jgi:hypothetical protein
MRQKIKCGARTRRGTPCQCKAIRTKRGALRCRLHGGLSTGPRTPEGRARIAEAMRRRTFEKLGAVWEPRTLRLLVRVMGQ